MLPIQSYPEQMLYLWVFVVLSICVTRVGNHILEKQWRQAILAAIFLLWGLLAFIFSTLNIT
jgi:hypothetical protein